MDVGRGCDFSQDEKREKLFGQREKLFGQREKLFGQREKLFGQREKLFGQREKLFGQRDLRYLVLSETRGDPSTLIYEVQ
jgi:hypothetical protein